MSKLEELINELCPNGVPFKKLECLATCAKGKQLNKEKLLEEGYPVINGGINPSGFWSSFNYPENRITISQGGASAGHVNWQKQKFWAGAHCYVLVNEKENINYRFLYHVIKNYERVLTERQYGAGIPALASKVVNSLIIPVPPMEVQCEIVRILDNFTELTSELTSELTARRKQYEYYRDDMIKNIDGRRGKLIDLLSQPITDGPHTTPVLFKEGVPFISATAVHEGRIHLEDAQGFISKEFDLECAKKYKPKKHDVYMVKSGSTTGKVGYVDFDDDFNIWSPLAAMRTDNPITARYVYHLLQTKSVQEMVSSRMSHGSQPNLSMRVLEQFDVNIPSIENQKRIVDMLDRFEKIANDKLSGLPVEIEARQKQYEFYRDKLLSFKEFEP